jgi:hypothetical protein
LAVIDRIWSLGDAYYESDQLRFIERQPAPEGGGSYLMLLPKSKQWMLINEYDCERFTIYLHGCREFIENVAEQIGAAPIGNGYQRTRHNNGMNAEPPIASFVKSMLIGSGPVNASVSQQTNGIHVTPILFIIGPSGVGKSHVSKQLEKSGFLYVHIDTDRPTRNFAAKGFSSEWDDDFRNVTIAHLVAVLRTPLEGAGTVVSFPTVDVFTPEMLAQASELGATPIVLWGTKEHCIKAAEERIRKKGVPFDRGRYERLNDPTFLAYGGREYDAFRIEAFREDGSRFPDDQLVANIMRRTAGYP